MENKWKIRFFGNIVNYYDSFERLSLHKTQLLHVDLARANLLNGHMAHRSIGLRNIMHFHLTQHAHEMNLQEFVQESAFSQAFPLYSFFRVN